MSYYDALFCSEQRMKNYTSLDENVRVKDLTPHILNAQDLYLQPILGTKFYQHLKDGIVNNSLSDDEQELCDDYIAKTVMYYSLYLVLPHIKYKMVDKGLLNGASEDTNPTTLEELVYLRQNAMDTAEFFAKRLVEHLKDYPGKYPQYENPGTKGMMPDKSTTYFSGLQTKVPHRKIIKNDCDPLDGPSTLSNS